MAIIKIEQPTAGGTRSFLVAQNSANQLANAVSIVSASGGVMTGLASLDVASGNIPGVSSVHKFGFNETVPNGSFADIWAYGPTDSTYNWPTTTEKFRIKAGGNAADTAAGAGAQSVTFQFLDATGVAVEETIATNGASASASTSATGRRFNRAFVAGAGTQYGTNTGQILIENETSGLVVAAIEAGIGQTQMSMYTVPLGMTAYLARGSISISVGLNKDADVRMWQRYGAYETSAPYSPNRLIHQWKAVQGDTFVKLEAMSSIPALTDLWLDAQGNGSTTAVDVGYDLFLVSD